MSAVEEAIGSTYERVEGHLKVTGEAPYAMEHEVDDPVYLYPIQSTIARGSITSIDVGEAESVDGVVAIITHLNAPELAADDDKDLFILQSEEIGFRGQFIGAVIAETSEDARRASDLVSVDYRDLGHDAAFSQDRSDLYAPEEVNAGYPTDSEQGDFDAAFGSAVVTIDETYTTPMEHNNPMEPHATTAIWDGELLTLYDSTQGVHPTRDTIAPLFGLESDQVRVIAPYVGGGFGSKGESHPNTVLAAMGAMVAEGRSVRFAITRQQMFAVAGYRTPTIQRVRLAASEQGELAAIAHEAIGQTSRIKEFAEQTAVPTRNMYAAGSRRTSHRLAKLDVPVPSWMRAPGECPGMFGPEVAMDELAIAVGVDPIDLRIMNEPEVDPETGNPFSSRNLVACLREGSRRFGWEERDPTPGVRRESDWLIGTGVAASMYPTMRMTGSVARMTRAQDGRYAVGIGAADIGNGSWTALSQIAADALGIPFDQIDLELGDTRLPNATVAGGSSGTNSWGTAIFEAAGAMRSEHGDDPPAGAEARGEAAENPDAERFAMAAFGAQFAEVRVNADTGDIRVPRLLGIFAAGRIVNPRMARSQFEGGMIMGLSMGLLEQSYMDTRTAHVANHDLAEYHVAANADIQSLEVAWIDEDDPHVNPMGTKGIGEIGITGTAAALSNAVHHATGIRVRDLPITPDKLLR